MNFWRFDVISKDRQRGALIGLAIGDAVGAAVEFAPPGSFLEVTGFHAGGPHGLEPGEWTDDISMALALADSIADVGWYFVERLVESSLPTHASPQCLSSCAYLGLVLCGLVNGQPREQVLAADWECLRQLEDCLSLHPEVRDVAKGSFERRQPPQIQGSGYVVHSLEAALWAFHDADDFREAVLRAVNLGDDAETTSAVCGQLAGANWGESGLPEEWRAGLGGRNQIEPILQRLFS
jgi:ADP-ribosylglycohydrolase